MATIERRDGDRDGWRVRWRSLDGRSRSHKCPDQRTAIQIAAEVDRSLARGIDWQRPRDRAAATRIEDVIAAYLAHRAVRVAPHTLRVDGNHLEVVGRYLAAQRVTLLRDLSRPLLDGLLAWLLKPGAALHGGQRKPASANRIAGAALLLWQWADEGGRYHDAPRAPRALDLAPAVPAAVVAPTWAEMDACVLAAQGWMRQLAVWLRYTGLRVGESMHVEWRDLNMQAGRLTIRPEIDKMRSGRTIPLHPLLLDEVATWGKREGYIIPCGRMTTRDARGRDLGRAWKRAGVCEEVWRQRPDHAFRRGFKSGLLAAGANADAVDFLQGHALGQGSRSRYIDGGLLPLAATLAMVPAISAGADAKVVPLRAMSPACPGGPAK